MDAKESLKYLQNVNTGLVNSLLLMRLNHKVLDDPRFVLSPGGITKHHDYGGGLVIHVAEVMRNVLRMTEHSYADELITAVIWHDYMKVRDYTVDAQGAVVKLPYHKLIGHVAGSALEFHSEASKCLPQDMLERIEHLLLSHHGRKEWGSPIEPATAEAFILHTADMMSATGANIL
jgi:3'-5' exoribonuclease